MGPLRSAARNERGGVMPFVALTIGLVVLGASFAVDLGFMTNVTRDMQKVADLAALDAAWQLDGSDHDTVAPVVEAAATESAQRNGHTGPDDVLAVEVGDWDPSTLTFTPTSGTDVPDAVRVEATTVHHNFLQPGSGELSRSAVATRSAVTGSSSTTTTTIVGGSSDPDAATFSAGSRLASVDTTQASLLNDIFSDALGGSASLTAVDYEGVANANLTMTEIGAHMTPAVGTPNELANATVTLDDLFSAMASALTAQGDAAAASVVTALGSSSASLETISVTVGDVLGVANGGEEAAAVAEMDVLGILTGTAFVSDGDHFINLPSLTVAVSGVTSTNAGLRIIEGMKTVSGPVGTSLSTSQVVLELDPTLDLDLSDLGAGLSAVGTLDIDTDLAGLDVTLTGMPCPSGPTTDLRADPRAAAADLVSDLTVEQTGLLGVTTALLNMTAEGSATVNPDPVDLLWSTPGELGLLKTVGTETPGLGSVDLTVTGTTVLGVLPLPLSTITTGVANELSATLGALDSAAVAQVADLLGISFSGGDIILLESACGPTSPPGGGSSGGSSGSSSFGIPELVA